MILKDILWFWCCSLWIVFVCCAWLVLLVVFVFCVFCFAWLDWILVDWLGFVIYLVYCGGTLLSTGVCMLVIVWLLIGGCLCFVAFPVVSFILSYFVVGFVTLIASVFCLQQFAFLLFSVTWCGFEVVNLVLFVCWVCRLCVAWFYGCFWLSCGLVAAFFGCFDTGCCVFLFLFWSVVFELFTFGVLVGCFVLCCVVLLMLVVCCLV